MAKVIEKCLTIQQKQELIKAYDNLRKLDKKMSKMEAARELCIHYTSLNTLLGQRENPKDDLQYLGYYTLQNVSVVCKVDAHIK